MTLSELCQTAHSDAVAKGWYETPRSLPELLMLIVSELSEAMEADRKRWISDRDPQDYLDGAYDEKWFADYIKDNLQDEIADFFIRGLDLCGYYKIDIEKFILAKMKYNRTRPKKHGKAY
jgi:NTP pyrophosphatase (non-canonical NTP hydrolase)